MSSFKYSIKGIKMKYNADTELCNEDWKQTNMQYILN